MSPTTWGRNHAIAADRKSDEDWRVADRTAAAAIPHMGQGSRRPLPARFSERQKGLRVEVGA